MGVVGPERELFVLMECVESSFGVGALEDYQWHAEHPGESPAIDLIRELEKRGYLTLTEVRHPHERNSQMHAEITPDGRKRMDDLLRKGVNPEAIWF